MRGKKRERNHGAVGKIAKREGETPLTRKDKQSAAKRERKARWEWRIKKGLMILSAFLFVFGLCVVDLGYSEMMGEEGKIIPSLRRVDEETVAVSAFGKSLCINTENMEIRVDDQDSH